jgi:Rieske Fe-S protein
MTQDVSSPAQPGTLTRRAVPAVVVVAGGVAGYLVAHGHDDGKGAGANSQFGSAGGGSAVGSAGGADGSQLARLDQVPAGGGVVLTRQGIVLTRDDAGTVHGFSATCTHQGCTVSEVSGGTINCPCHGSQFDASTGAPVAGPAPTPLAPVSVTVRDGAVFAS